MTNKELVLLAYQCRIITTETVYDFDGGSYEQTSINESGLLEFVKKIRKLEKDSNAAPKQADKDKPNG